jgi:lactate dehydrogenase-like 2-hydroxyacid dehydrogenase
VTATSRVLVTRRLPSKVVARLEARHEVDRHDGESLPAEELRAHVRDKQAIVCVLTDRIDAAVIDAAPELKIVANVAVGYDNVHGKQLGILGMGRIGRAVAARAPAFGMSVVYHRGSTPEARPVSFDELLVTSDVISIHMPLTPDTRHLIDQRSLARMKRSAYLINTSRGPVVDEEALAWGLRERLIAGAALDVFEREPEVHANLLDLDNVVLAPHLGSATRETRTAMADLAVSNVLAVLDGSQPLTPV